MIALHNTGQNAVLRAGFPVNIPFTVTLVSYSNLMDLQRLWLTFQLLGSHWILTPARSACSGESS